MAENCSNCRFFINFEGNFECHRRASVSVPAMFYGLCLAIAKRLSPLEAAEFCLHDSDDPHWPQVEPDQWCGEYEPESIEIKGT